MNHAYYDQEHLLGKQKWFHVDLKRPLCMSTGSSRDSDVQSGLSGLVMKQIRHVCVWAHQCHKVFGCHREVQMRSNRRRV